MPEKPTACPDQTPALARLVRRPGERRHDGALPRADAELRADARRAPVGPADHRDRADRLRHHALQPAPSRARDAASATGSARPAGSPFEFPIHPIQETCKRPTAMLDRNLQYLSLVEILYGYPTRRRRADDRLRQDDAGAAHGRRHGRHPGDRPLRRPDAERLAQRRAHGLRDDRLEGARAAGPAARSTTRSSSSWSPRRPPRPGTATRWAPRRP